MRPRVDASTWDAAMPALGPALLEVLCKGWLYDGPGATERTAGTAPDLHRCAAVQLLHKLGYDPAADLLLGTLMDDDAEECLRAHCASALCRIGLPRTLDPLLRLGCSGRLPDLVRRQLGVTQHNFVKRWHTERGRYFDRRRAVRILARMLTEEQDVETRRRAVWRLGAFYGKCPTDARYYVRTQLKRSYSREKDAEVKSSIRDELRSARYWGRRSDREGPNRLEFDECIPAKYWPVLEAAAVGEANPKTLRKLRARYLKAVDGLAGSYSGSNAFATTSLHEDGWLDGIELEEPKTFYRAAAMLRPGMTRDEVIEKLGVRPGEILLRDTDLSLGPGIERLHIERYFMKEFRGPFKSRGGHAEVVVIFVDGRVRIVHGWE